MGCNYKHVRAARRTTKLCRIMLRNSNKIRCLKQLRQKDLKLRRSILLACKIYVFSLHLMSNRREAKHYVKHSKRHNVCSTSISPKFITELIYSLLWGFRNDGLSLYILALTSKQTYLRINK